MTSNNVVKRFLTFIIEVLLLGLFLGLLSNIIPIPPTPIKIIILSAITLLLAIILFCLKFLWPRLPNKPKKPVILTVGIASSLTIILSIVLVWPTQQNICQTLANVENYISIGKRSLTQKDTLDEKDREQQIYDNNKDLNENNSYLLALAIPAKTEPQAAKAMLAGVADAQTKFNQPYKDPTKPRISEKLLKIVVVDDRNNENNFAKEVACQIAQNPNILGVIGHHSSGSSIAALDTYAKAGITMITPTSTSTELNQNSGKVFFRTTVNNKAFGSSLAKKIEALGKVIVFYEGDNKYAEDLKQQFIQALGTNQVKTENIKNWTSANNIDNLKIPPEVKAAVIFSSSGDGQKHEIAIKLIKKLKRTRPDLKLFGGDSLYKGSTLYDGKTDIEGLKLVIPWFPVKSDGQIISDYATKSAATWGGPINWMTASSYDATQAFLAAIAQVETSRTSRTSRKVDRKSVLDSMPNVYLEQKDTSGAGLKFDNGEPKDFDNGEPKDRKPIFVEVVQKEKLPKILQCNLEVCFKPVE